MAQEISQLGVDLIQSFEDCRLEAYICPAGKPTIGWGSTGPHVSLGQTITQAEADALFKADLSKFEQGIRELVKVPLTQPQYDALISFTYNCGLSAFKKSTLLKLLNAGKFGQAADELRKWVKAKGKTLPGLVRRREAERELFLRPEITSEPQEAA
jgi:GH24 family phage-related lysozyme (muramidase)